MATRERTYEPHSSLHYALWAAQVFLAVSFAVAGLIKVALPFSQVGEYLAWAKDQPEPLIRFIGVCELSAVFGLTVPGWTRTLPSLIPITAFALMGLMFLAIGFHLMRHEVGLIGAPLIMLALSTFVAFGRTAVPIPPSEHHRAGPRPLTR
jgi:hypothetical protein